METDPAYAATWFFDYGNAVREVLNSGDQEPKPEALAFSARALYTIASRLPPNIISNIQAPSGTAIGAKRGGTQEQCSQKLFELAEIFRKIIKNFINYR